MSAKMEHPASPPPYSPPPSSTAVESPSNAINPFYSTLLAIQATTSSRTWTPDRPGQSSAATPNHKSPISQSRQPLHQLLESVSRFEQKMSPGGHSGASPHGSDRLSQCWDTSIVTGRASEELASLQGDVVAMQKGLRELQNQFASISSRLSFGSSMHSPDNAALTENSCGGCNEDERLSELQALEPAPEAPYYFQPLESTPAPSSEMADSPSKHSLESMREQMDLLILQMEEMECNMENTIATVEGVCSTEITKATKGVTHQLNHWGKEMKTLRELPTVVGALLTKVQSMENQMQAMAKDLRTPQSSEDIQMKILVEEGKTLSAIHQLTQRVQQLEREKSWEGEDVVLRSEVNGLKKTVDEAFKAGGILDQKVIQAQRTLQGQLDSAAAELKDRVQITIDKKCRDLEGNALKKCESLLDSVALKAADTERTLMISKNQVKGISAQMNELQVIVSSKIEATEEAHSNNEKQINDLFAHMDDIMTMSRKGIKEVEERQDAVSKTVMDHVSRCQGVEHDYEDLIKALTNSIKDLDGRCEEQGKALYGLKSNSTTDEATAANLQECMEHCHQAEQKAERMMTKVVAMEEKVNDCLIRSANAATESKTYQQSMSTIMMEIRMQCEQRVKVSEDSIKSHALELSKQMSSMSKKVRGQAQEIEELRRIQEEAAQSHLKIRQILYDYPTIKKDVDKAQAQLKDIHHASSIGKQHLQRLMDSIEGSHSANSELHTRSLAILTEEDTNMNQDRANSPSTMDRFPSQISIASTIPAQEWPNQQRRMEEVAQAIKTLTNSFQRLEEQFSEFKDMKSEVNQALEGNLARTIQKVMAHGKTLATIETQINDIPNQNMESIGILLNTTVSPLAERLHSIEQQIEKGWPQDGNQKLQGLLWSEDCMEIKEAVLEVERAVKDHREGTEIQCSTLKGEVQAMETDLKNVERYVAGLENAMGLSKEDVHEKYDKIMETFAQEIAYFYALFELSRPEVRDVVQRGSPCDKIRLLHTTSPFASIVSMIKGHQEGRPSDRPETGPEDGIRDMRDIRVPTVYPLPQKASPTQQATPQRAMASQQTALQTTPHRPQHSSQHSSQHSAIPVPQTNQVRATMGLDVTEGQPMGIDGVCAAVVTEGGPAFQAGIMVGDFITSINGIPAPEKDVFKQVMQSQSPGAVVQCSMVKSGTLQTLQVPVALASLQPSHQATPHPSSCSGPRHPAGSPSTSKPKPNPNPNANPYPTQHQSQPIKEEQAQAKREPSGVGLFWDVTNCIPKSPGNGKHKSGLRASSRGSPQTKPRCVWK